MGYASIEVRRQKDRERHWRNREKRNADARAYYNKNRETLCEYQRLKREENPAAFKDRDRAKYAKGRDKALSRAKDYAAENKVRIAARMRRWNQQNSDRRRVLKTEYARRKREEDPIYREREREYHRQWNKRNARRLLDRHKVRRQVDPCLRIRLRLRGRLRSLLAARKILKKECSVVELIGCSVSHLRQHLESQFEPGMSWDTRAQWHIDHIKPCTAFNLLDVVEQKLCFHWTNLRPLWASENLRKYNKILV